MTDFATRAADKLQAAINHNWDDPDRVFAPAYIGACALWFDELSGWEKFTAALAVKVFEDGSEAEAKRMVESLPTAPKFPLSPH
jgi:hypothetical protein